MTITITTTGVDNKGLSLEVGSIWTILSEEDKTLKLRKTGRGKQPIAEISRWKLAKICNDIKSTRGGKRQAGVGRKIGRPRVDNGRKIRTIYCDDNEIQMLRQVLADSRNWANLDCKLSYKKALKDYLEGLS